MEIESKILSKAEDLFMQYGLKSITMDEVSKELGISKKTLYQFVENKADLILKVVQMHIKKEEAEMLRIKKEATNAIEEMLGLSRHVNQLLQKVNPAIIYDLQKYYHEGWELMRSLQKEFTYRIFRENIEKGIMEGLYRTEINADVIAKLFVGRSDLILDQHLFPLSDYTRTELHREFITYHLYGIMTEKGIDFFKQHQSK